MKEILFEKEYGDNKDRLAKITGTIRLDKKREYLSIGVQLYTKYRNWFGKPYWKHDTDLPFRSYFTKDLKLNKLLDELVNTLKRHDVIEHKFKNIDILDKIRQGLKDSIDKI